MGIHRKALHSRYFAALHALRSLLVAKGMEPTTHKHVHILFALNLVKPGTVSTASATILSELQAIRERADYRVKLSYIAAIASLSSQWATSSNASLRFSAADRARNGPTDRLRP